MNERRPDDSKARPEDFDGPEATLDDWRWHVEGEFPRGLDPGQGYVHIGVFVSWLACHGMLDADWIDRAGLVSLTLELVERRVAPCALRDGTAGQLTRSMLKAEGAAFASAYYAPQYGYPSDWRRVFGRAADAYAVPGTWETYDRMAPVVDERYSEWTKAGRPELMQLPGPLGLLSRILRPWRT